MACQMGFRSLFADKGRCAVSDRMTLGAVLVTVFTLLVFDLVMRRPETSATFLPILLEIFSSGTERNLIGRRTESDRAADAARRKAQEKRAPITAYFELFL